MSAFDTKSEVIDFHLTNHGKKKLMEGRLKPAYYAFFDDDIIYDPQYAGVLDGDSENAVRIEEYTVRVKGATPKTVEEVEGALGVSSQNRSVAPAWNIQLHSGDFSAFSAVDSREHNRRIPQLSSSFEYRAEVRKQFDEEVSDGVSIGSAPDELRLDAVAAVEYNTGRLPDDTYISVRGEYIFLEILEENTPFNKENFDVEFFIKSEEELANGTEREIWLPLRYDGGGEESERVGTYFDVFMDDDIDDSIFCKHIEVDTRKGVFLKPREQCVDFDEGNGDDNFYRSIPNKNEGSGEIC